MATDDLSRVARASPAQYWLLVCEMQIFLPCFRVSVCNLPLSVSSEWVIKFNSLSWDGVDQGPWNPYKPCFSVKEWQKMQISFDGSSNKFQNIVLKWVSAVLVISVIRT